MPLLLHRRCVTRCIEYLGSVRETAREQNQPAFGDFAPSLAVHCTPCPSPPPCPFPSPPPVASPPAVSPAPPPPRSHAPTDFATPSNVVLGTPGMGPNEKMCWANEANRKGQTLGAWMSHLDFPKFANGVKILPSQFLHFRRQGCQFGLSLLTLGTRFIEQVFLLPQCSCQTMQHEIKKETAVPISQK